jgi:uncharacterized protein (DUF2235 family)
VKRIAVCCDGTWNVANQEHPTNVVKLALAVKKEDSEGVAQQVFYSAGVGTTRGARIRGGAFGVGLSRNVRECYRFLVENYEPGDRLFFFGFSRGAFTARSAAGMVRNCGILRREHADRIDDAFALYRARGRDLHPRGTEATLFRRSFSHVTRIHFIGVWDTVGALGIPVLGRRIGFARLINRRWGFHDTTLSRTVDLAYHALAIDEERGPFEPAMWHRQEKAHDQTLEQVWFAGAHSDVGGGSADPSLSEIPLLWIADKAAAAGLDFDDPYFSGTLRPGRDAKDEREEARHIVPSPTGPIHPSRKRLYKLIRRHTRAPGLERVPEEPGSDKEVVAAGQRIASSVRDRLGVEGYGSDELRRFMATEEHVAPVRTVPGLPDQ